MSTDWAADRVAFLSARLKEDEEFAREAVQRPWRCEDNYVETPDGGAVARFEIKADARFAAWNDPARVLREVEADRNLLAALAEARKFSDHMFSSSSPEGVAPGEVLGERMRAATQVLTLERVIAIRAERFSDHPDYHPEWVSRFSAGQQTSPGPESSPPAPHPGGS